MALITKRLPMLAHHGRHERNARQRGLFTGGFTVDTALNRSLMTTTQFNRSPFRGRFYAEVVSCVECAYQWGFQGFLAIPCDRYQRLAMMAARSMATETKPAVARIVIMALGRLAASESPLPHD